MIYMDEMLNDDFNDIDFSEFADDVDINITSNKPQINQQYNQQKQPTTKPVTQQETQQTKQDRQIS